MALWLGCRISEWKVLGLILGRVMEIVFSDKVPMWPSSIRNASGYCTIVLF